MLVGAGAASRGQGRARRAHVCQALGAARQLWELFTQTLRVQDQKVGLVREYSDL